MTLTPGATLRIVRERRPLVHQITNYVVMNETANATLALGALPVMAHAPEEVEEMVGFAGALVLNIGTLSEHWVEAMLLAGKAANARGIPVVLDPVGAGATRFRTETAARILDEVDVAVLRGNAGEVATLVGVEAEVRGVESIGAGGEPADLAREAGRSLGLVAAVTGPVDHVSDGETAVAVANGDPLLAAVTGHRLHVERAHRVLPRRQAGGAARGGRRGARRLRGRGRGRGRRGQGAGLVPRGALRRARRPRSRHAGRADPLRVHAIVEDLATAQAAVAAGATVVQLRLKGATTDRLVEVGRPFRELGATFVVNDDVEAAVELGADGVHLGRGDEGAERALAAGLMLGLSASSRREAAVAEFAGAAYIGAGPVWATPSKPDADPPIGLDGLQEICMSVTVPVVAIGGVDASNAAACIRAGASGVAAIRAATDPELRAAVDAAL